MNLQKLEEERLILLQSYKKKSEIGCILLAIGLLFVIIYIGVLIADIKREPIFVIALVVGILLVLLALIFLFLALNENHKYSKRIKNIVIKEILDSIYQDVIYDNLRSIDIEPILSLGAFPRPDRSHGENYYSGTYENIKFETCEISLEHKVMHSKKRSLSSNSYQPYFIGRYFVFDFKQKLDETILIIEAKFLDGFNPRDLKEIETENTEFNQRFKIYSSNENIFSHVVTPAFMERLLKIGKQNIGQICVVFKDNNIHLAFNDKKDHFKFNIKTPLTEEGLKKIAENLTMPQNIVSDLHFKAK